MCKSCLGANSGEDGRKQEWESRDSWESVVAAPGKVLICH